MTTLTHLQRLEAESIHILREVVSEAERPVMLYSVGKDSAVMLHLARRRPSSPARRRSRCCTSIRPGSSRRCTKCATKMAREAGMELLVHQNPGSQGPRASTRSTTVSLHTDMWKTEGLKQALDQLRLRRRVRRCAPRRGEEPRQGARFSHSGQPIIAGTRRTSARNLWNLYNTRKAKGESIRVFPISNWTELDIWQYIHLEGHPDRAAVFLGGAAGGGARRQA